MKRALVVDDERQTRRLLQVVAEGMGMEAVPAENGRAGLEQFDNGTFDVVLTDLKMPGMDGIELLQAIRERDAAVPVVVLTAHGTVKNAVEAMKWGAYDFLLKPFEVDAIEMVVRRALEARTYRTENSFLREHIDGAEPFENLIGISPAMRATYELVRQVAPTKSAVLITGETGTGKELVARAIHNQSPRSSRLFVPVNCAAIPADLLESELFGHVRGAFTGAQDKRSGKFEVADGGTLFLDEIGDMPQLLQAKLLRALQDGVIEAIGSDKPSRVDVRIVSSTNRDLAASMESGAFRSDLYYRLNVFHMQLPPLRERPEDIQPLADFLLDEQRRELGREPLALQDDAAALLRGYPWPGNVRELRNLMERLAVLCSGPEVDLTLLRSLLPGDFRDVDAECGGDDLRLETALGRAERKQIIRALNKTNQGKPEAAELLGVSERTLWNKLKKHGL